MTIGLSLTQTYAVYSQTVTVSFWRPGPFYIDPITKTGWLKWVAYTDQATFLANCSNYYAPSQIIFAFTPTNWPFVPGTDPMSKFWAFVQSHTTTADADGNTINGGIDWSTATLSTL